jgi:hypothetical protein
MPKHYSDSESEYSSSEDESERSDYSSSASESEEEKPKASPVRKPKAKRAKSAYLFFCDAERKKIKKQHPKWDAKKTMQELGKRWRKLDDKARKPFERKANKAKKELA